MGFAKQLRMQRNADVRVLKAQLDLVEFTLAKAYLGAGRLDDLRRLAAARRSGPCAMLVAGLEAALH